MLGLNGDIFSAPQKSETTITHRAKISVNVVHCPDRGGLRMIPKKLTV